MIDKENLQDLYPLSPMQEGMLFQWLVDPDSDAYVEQIAYRLRGSLDVGLFENCWREMFRRHNVLRTVFVYEKTARPLQVVLKESHPHLHFEDLRDRSPEERVRVLAAFRLEDRKRGFDLSKDVLSRISVFQLAAESYEVVWSFHHIVLDGWSVGLVLSELMGNCIKREKPDTTRTVAEKFLTGAIFNGWKFWIDRNSNAIGGTILTAMLESPRFLRPCLAAPEMRISQSC